jgi:hypothetical protein
MLSQLPILPQWRAGSGRLWSSNPLTACVKNASPIPLCNQSVKIPRIFQRKITRVTKRRFLRLICRVLFAAVFSGASGGSAVAAFVPEPDLWERWTAHSPSQTAIIDHSAWDAFLEQYLVVRPSGVNRVAYAQVSSANKKRLDAYLTSLSAVPISDFSRDEQRAYWINLYNALTVKVVLDHYPVDSIRDISISPGFFSIGPWKKKLVRVEGEEISLDDIEHRILRPIWKDPRIHYALNCASLGCPNLMPKAFTATNTEEFLDKGARDFINSPHGVRFVTDTGLTVSSIYDWFQVDFGDSEIGVIDHLRLFAHPALAAKLKGVNEIDDFQYDWTLNSLLPAQSPP